MTTLPPDVLCRAAAVRIHETSRSARRGRSSRFAFAERRNDEEGGVLPEFKIQNSRLRIFHSGASVLYLPVSHL
jgi:hypothetical protein